LRPADRALRVILIQFLADGVYADTYTVYHLQWYLFPGCLVIHMYIIDNSGSGSGRYGVVMPSAGRWNYTDGRIVGELVTNGVPVAGGGGEQVEEGGGELTVILCC